MSRGAGTELFISEALAGDTDIAFEEVDDGFWTIWFASMVLARYDERHRRMQSITRFTEGRSPAAPARA